MLRGRASAPELLISDALSSSLELSVALERAYPLLLSLVSADYAALGVTNANEPLGFRWTDVNLAPGFFADYSVMAPHDFVRDAVASQPGLVLRDHQMLTQRAYEQHFLYRYTRAAGSPVQHVMAVMLPVGPRTLSGLAMYRARRRQFSERDALELQRVTRSLANTVRNCREHDRFARAGATAEAIVEADRVATLLVDAPARELARSASASALLDQWFLPGERVVGGLPSPLASALAPFVTASAMPGQTPPQWQRRRNDHVLEVTFMPITGSARRTWQLFMEVSFRPTWANLLTPREREVLRLMCEGWDNQYIAQDLDCAVATVKKHVSSILRSAGVDRTMLVARRLSV